MGIKKTRLIAPISAASSMLILLLGVVSRFSCGPGPHIEFFDILPIFIVNLVLFLAATLVILFDGRRTGKCEGKKYIVFALFVNVFLISAFMISAHNHAQMAARLNNLKVIYAALEAYAHNNNDALPPINKVKNNFIFDASVLYPQYISDLSVLMHPSEPDVKPEKAVYLRSTERHLDSSFTNIRPDCVTFDRYCYFGWALTSDEEAEMFFEAYDLLAADQYDYDLQVPEGRGNPIGKWFGAKDTVRGDMIRRLSLGVDRYMFSEAALNQIGSSPYGWIQHIPVMWERQPKHESPFKQEAPPALVVYMDGHIESIRLGDKFPMTQTMKRLLGERKREPIPDCED